MIEFYALLRKQLAESRWTLGLSAIALFGLSWLFVLVTSGIEAQLRDLGLNDGPNPRQFLQRFGDPDMEMTSAALEVMLWNHPLIYLPIAVWSISRGSAAVSAEIERGTLDLVLSRPVSRSRYLTANVLFSCFGLLILVMALVAGNAVGNRYLTIDSPPRVSVILKPAFNIMALGLVIFAYTFLPSAIESVRWRPILAASVLTIVGMIIHIAVRFPTLDRWKYFDNYTIFKAFNPIELVNKGETFVFNVGILTGISAIAITAAYLIFAHRDLPANS